MEGGVEHGDVRYAGQHRRAASSASRAGRAVERCELAQARELALHVSVDQHRIAKLRAAVNDPVGDGAHVVGHLRAIDRRRRVGLRRATA